MALRKDFKNVVTNITPSILKAVEFLYRELNVVEYRLLPYNQQLIFIMTFFNRLSNPNKKQIQELKRWFWVTTYSNYFTIYSLSNQRKAFRHFLKFLNSEVDNSVFSDNYNMPFRALPFPKTISLSAVRSKALILFELQIYRERSKKGPTIYGVTLGKLNPKLQSISENIIPTYTAKNYKSFNSNIMLSNSQDNYWYLIPSYDKNENFDKCLEKRRELIIQEERNFVEKQGIIYTK